MSQRERGTRRVVRSVAAATATLAAAGGTLLACAFAAPGAGDGRPVAGPGPCVPGRCPAAYPDPHGGAVVGRDNGVNVFVGGDFAVRDAAAGAEGRVVVEGEFDLAKGSGSPQAYHVGAVGVGSRVPPDNGSPFLRVGGDLKLAAGQRLLAEDGPVNGTVAFAGRQTGTGTVSPKAVRDTGALAAFDGLREELTAASTCYAYDKGVPRKPTGTAVNQGKVTVFTGDGISAFQVFNAPFDLVAPDGSAQSLSFRKIPAIATVLVNVTDESGEARTINTSAVALAGVRRERLLWNIPDAKVVRIAGGGQLQGSVLVGRRSSTTRLSATAVNGRVFTAGSLAHESGTGGAGGQTIHAYPFVGVLPECGTGPTPDGGHTDTGEPVPFPTGVLPPGFPGLEGLEGLEGLMGRPGVAGPDDAAPAEGHELPREGPPMRASMAVGATLIAVGAALALAVLFRTRSGPGSGPGRRT
ncbi:choice-of-anchor A family protein [Streptomyces triculaminicus]|uniref:choice-of-anchor A family protein n=1 Tax=Streptomyces triculaminicus TaxID=2816232 RepID=UPI0037CDA8D5